jgi:hypothetical protein
MTDSHLEILLANGRYECPGAPMTESEINARINGDRAGYAAGDYVGGGDAAFRYDGSERGSAMRDRMLLGLEPIGAGLSIAWPYVDGRPVSAQEVHAASAE